MTHNVERGMMAENYFTEILKAHDLEYVFTDDFFDFTVNNFKVEVKSASPSVKFVTNGKKSFRTGRYDFTNEENREKQFNEDVWVCFIIQHHNQFMIQGFANAKTLEKRRYVGIVEARKFDLLTFDEWKEHIMRAVKIKPHKKRIDVMDFFKQRIAYSLKEIEAAFPKLSEVEIFELLEYNKRAGNLFEPKADMFQRI